MKDAPSIDHLLSEWFDCKPSSGRLKSIQRAVRRRELLVAEIRNEVIGFVHYVMHEDVIDGGPHSFITAFYLSGRYRGRGVGALLLEALIRDSLKRGAVGIETSTIHARAERFYEKHHFKHTIGDIGEVFLELDIPEYLQAKKSGQ